VTARAAGVKKKRNLLAMTPRRIREWDEEEDGRVRVLVPRYGTHALGRWLATRMAKAPIKVRLDSTGSLVWKACDGNRNVAQIAELVTRDLGAGSDDLHARMAAYFRELEVSRFISWQ